MERYPWLRRTATLLLVPALVAASFYVDRYSLYIANLVLIYVVLGLGLNFILGYAGQFAFAHAALMGIGAYTTALLTARAGVSFWICLPLSGVTAALLGAVVALPALRMKRVYLALVTLAFSQLVGWVLINWRYVTLGTDGVSLPSPRFFGIRIHGDRPVFYVVLATTVVLYWIGRRLMETRFGRALVTIRENEIVARCNGINVVQVKLAVFTLSAFYAGIGGSLYALTLGYIVPDAFGLAQITLHFSIVVLGGLLSLYGAVVGSIVLTILPEALRDAQALQEIVYGLVLMVVVLVVPDGLSGLLKRFGLLPREVMARNWRRLAPR
jgi:branched-chain amino acid transport system permease protein